MLRRVASIVLASACVAPAHALYDPRPDASLAAVQGAWSGSLTYRDYQRPDRMVTLPTQVFVALATPDALVLHYVFDDGPGKTVYSYERMRVDFAAATVSWTTGDADRSASVYRIVSTEREAATTRVVFEAPQKKGGEGSAVTLDRFTIELGALRFTLKKEEVDTAGASLLRNTFVFGPRAMSARAGRILGGLLLACGLVSGASAQSLALSFDDGFDPRVQPQAPAWNAAILDALAYAEVRSILFAAGKHVDTPAGLGLVRAWGDAGHAIANHTYLHPSLGSARTTLAAFIADVERNEALLKDQPGWTRRLRFPYLKEGDTAAKRDGMRDWMVAHDYRSGAVSIDASDWYYDARYRAWRSAHPDDDPTPIRAAYLAHLASRAAYYDGLSQRLFRRSVAHVPLLHTNAINAAFLPDVMAMFRASGWTLIAPEDAYRDPVYAMRPGGLPAGESILWSLARQAGIAGLRYPAEDDVYEKPVLDALGL